MEVASTQIRFAPGAEGLLSPLLPWLTDKSVSEILVNKPQEVYIEKGGVMTRHALPALDRMHLKRLFTFIANEANQEITELSPILSGNLYDGSRIQLVMPPSAKEYTLSIRRHSVKKLTLNDYRQSNFYNKARKFDIYAPSTAVDTNDDAILLKLYQEENWPDFMEAAVAFKKNIVLSGQTSSGKTTYLNALVSHIPLSERIITLEDNYEIDVPHANQVNLQALKKTSCNQPVVSMQDLVQCSLRLRPDRLIMGEIRGAEILDFISACSTGHQGSITTIHAQNPRVAYMRMIQLVRLNNVPSMRDEDIQRLLDEVVDIIVQVNPQGSERLLTCVHYKNASLHHLQRVVA